MNVRGWLAFGLAVALIATAGGADAATSDQRVMAEALFDEGISLMKAKRYQEACPKFAESQKLDPSSGTAFNLARCFQLTNRLASAWAGFRDAAAIARRDGDSKRAKLSKRAADAIEPKLARLVVNVPVAHRVQALEVFRDDVELPLSSWDVAVPIDAGGHEISAKAPGRAGWRTKISVPSKPDTITINVPLLTPREVLPPADEGASSATTYRGVAIGLAAVGLVGMAISTAFTVVAVGKNDDSRAHCDDSGCDDTGFDLRTEARTAGDVATGAFIAGAATLGGGVTLWLLAPSSSSDRAAGIGWTARW